MSDDILDVQIDDSDGGGGGHGGGSGGQAPGAPGQPPAPTPPGRAHGREAWLWPFLAALLVLLLVAPALYLLLGSPQARARRHFLRGVALQTTGDYDGAAQQFTLAMGLDKHLAAAGVRLGLARLHLGSPMPDPAYLQQLVQDASKGKVAALDQADWAFQQALTMAQSAPRATTFPDADEPGLKEVQANALAGLGLTSVLRAAGDIGADESDKAWRLASDAQGYVARARRYDPTNIFAGLVSGLAQVVQTWARVGKMGLL